MYFTGIMKSLYIEHLIAFELQRSLSSDIMAVTAILYFLFVCFMKGIIRAKTYSDASSKGIIW